MVSSEIPAPSSLVDAEDSEPDVIVLTVTYNSADVIEEFLRALGPALERAGPCQVVSVDNASSDATADLVRTLAPWVTLLEPGVNRGYAAGINLALRGRRARKGVYVLNPDALPSPGSVRALLDAVSRDPEVGLAVPRVLDSAGRLKFSLRREPTILRALGEAVLGGHRAARFRALGDMIRDPGYYLDGATADWATGAALFLSAEALRRVGSWDEQFFLYSEETDYALRLRDVGLSLRFVPEAVVVHPGGAMSRSPWLWSLVTVNRTRLYRKRHGAIRSAAFWMVVFVNEAARAALGRPTHRAAVRALLLGPMPPE
ncbi:MAG TPA: glycosyltransferase family 2 protein [Propionibacteriaceae bacterium]|nr:glycosyltransferase family 2 protein [Propionibacteriaceae bacterium]